MLYSLSDSSFRDLKRIEKRLRDYYLVTLEILKTTRSLAEAESNEERAEISRGIEENLILLEILKKEITEDLLTYAIRYQPLGRDFRRAHAFLDILYDIFRIGRYCREIALVDKYVKKLSDESLRDLRRLLDLAREAYENSYRALFEDCETCGERVREIDNEVDELYINSLKKAGAVDTLPNSAVAKVLVMRHVERIVDHTVSIASHS